MNQPLYGQMSSRYSSQSVGRLTDSHLHFYICDSIVHIMLGLSPWSNWPLHVKIFTQEAVQAWNNAAYEKPDPDFSLPRGLTYSIELEGVDGKRASENVGSGRTGSIDISDSKYSFISFLSFPLYLTYPGALLTSKLSLML